MFNAQVPEKMIKEVTGHHSTKALGLYERPSLAQKKAVSKVLAEGGRFSQEVKLNRLALPMVLLSLLLPVLTGAIHAHSAKQLDPAGLLSSLFSGLTNCTINFAPQ